MVERKYCLVSWYTSSLHGNAGIHWNAETLLYYGPEHKICVHFKAKTLKCHLSQSWAPFYATSPDSKIKPGNHSSLLSVVFGEICVSRLVSCEMGKGQ